MNQGDPRRRETGAGVRAPIVAKKRGNARGAKAGQEGECAKDTPMETRSEIVPETAKEPPQNNLNNFTHLIY